jgi:outer membrane protein assembly factor BamB
VWGKGWGAHVTGRLSRKTTVATIVLIVALLVSGAAALQFATNRAPIKHLTPLTSPSCTGVACTGQDPSVEGCFTDAEIVLTLSIPANGNADLLFSPSCGAYWGLAVSSPSTAPLPTPCVNACNIHPGQGPSGPGLLTLQVSLQGQSGTNQAKGSLQLGAAEFTTPLYGEASPTAAQLCGTFLSTSTCSAFTLPASSPAFAANPCSGQTCTGRNPGSAGCLTGAQPYLPIATGQFSVQVYYSASCSAYWSVGKNATALDMTLLAQGWNAALPAHAISMLTALSGSSQMVGGVPAASACGQNDTSAQFCTGFAYWPAYGYDAPHTGFNVAETTLTPSNVGGLHRQWPASIGATGKSISDQPIVGNDMIYWGTWDYGSGNTAGTMHAADLNGNPVWSTVLGSNNFCNGGYLDSGIGSTAALTPINGLPGLIVGGADGKVYALNALTGTAFWSTPLLESGGVIWASPAIDNGSAYIGTASSDCDAPLVQGRLYKLNVNTGAVQAEFNAVPNGCTGGGIWGTPSVDSAAGLVYFGTGNNGNCTAGSGNYSEEIVALNTSNLSVHASIREQASDLLNDYDFGSAATLLFTAPGGTQLVGINTKDGNFYALNRGTLTVAWTDHISDAGGDAGNGRGSIAPGVYDGTTLYVAGGRSSTAGMCSSSQWGFVAALNPANGSILWKTCLTWPIVGALSMVAGLIVVPMGWVRLGGDPAYQAGSIFVLNAANGSTLYQYNEPSTSGTFGQFWGPVTIADGHLYAGNSDGNLIALGL